MRSPEFSYSSNVALDPGRLQESFSKLESIEELDKRVHAMDMHLGYVLHTLLGALKSDTDGAYAEKLWDLAGIEVGVIDETWRQWYEEAKSPISGRIRLENYKYNTMIDYRAIKGYLDGVIETRGEIDIEDALKHIEFNESVWGENYWNTAPISFEQIAAELQNIR